MAAEDVRQQRVKNILSSFLASLDTNSSSDGNEDRIVEFESSATPVLSDHRDQDAFYKRVETFTTSKWLAKPADVSPLVCAQYGWENTDTDVLKCVTCKSIFCGQLPNLKNPKLYRESHKKLKDSLVEAHQDVCPWKNNCSPGSYLTVSFENRAETLKKIQSTYEDFITTNMNFPFLSYKTLEEIGMDEDRFHSGVTQIYPDLFTDKPINVSTFCLALFGWKPSPSQPQVLLCERCWRKVGIWDFKCAISTQNGNSVSSPASGMEGNGLRDSPTNQGSPQTKKRKLAVKEGFDPISEHRLWCPWVATHLSSDDLQQRHLSPGSHSYSNLSVQNTSTNSQANVSFSNQNTYTDSTSTSLDEDSMPMEARSNSSCSSDLNNSLPNSQSFSNSSGNRSCDTSPGKGSCLLTPTRGLAGEYPNLPSWKMLLLLLSLWKPENLTSSHSNEDLKLSPTVRGMRHIRKFLREWSSAK